MLRITQEQRRFFQSSAWEVFVAEMAKHMWTFAPDHCRVIGESQVRHVVSLGLERAKACGFTYRGPLRFYLELMFMFGTEFDSDPQFPAWARDLLRVRTVDDQMYRADRLFRGLSDFHDRAVGTNRQLVIRALERTLTFARAPLPYTDQDLAPGLLASMRRLYPEKFDYLGAGAHRALIEHGLRVADRCQLTTARGRTTLCLAMTMMGHGVVGDPLYPWFDVPLRGHASPEKRAARLECRVVIYLEHTLENIGGPRGQGGIEQAERS